MRAKNIFATASAAMSVFGANAELCKVQFVTLENGLTVVMAPTQANKTVQFAIVYKVGCAHDPWSMIGLSHFLEHMMFKGTKKLTCEALNKSMNKYTAYVNAFTGDDITAYYCKIKEETLDFILKLEAERMLNLKISQKDFDSEKQVIQKERLMRVDYPPQTRYFMDAVLRTLYIYAKYGINGIGYPEHIENYTRDALLSHYETYYAPDNAIIFVVGDFDSKEVLEKIKKIFGKIKKRKLPVQERTIDPVKTGLRFYVDHASEQLATKELSVVYTFSRKNVDTLRKYLMLKIILTALCGNRRSVLYKRFVGYEQRLFSINGFADIKEIDKVLVMIEASLHNEVSRSEIEKDITNAIDKFIESDFTEELFVKIRESGIRSIILLTDNPSDYMMKLIEYITLGYDYRDINQIDKIIKSIKYDEILAFAKAILSLKNKTHVFYSHPEIEKKASKSKINSKANKK